MAITFNDGGSSLSLVNATFYREDPANDHVAVIDLTQSPFNLDFKGNPVAASVMSSNPPTAAVSLDKRTLTFTLTNPTENVMYVTVALFYA